MVNGVAGSSICCEACRLSKGRSHDRRCMKVQCKRYMKPDCQNCQDSSVYEFYKKTPIVPKPDPEKKRLRELRRRLRNKK